MKFSIIVCLLGFFLADAQAQKVYTIWPGVAPGSEGWDWHEQVDTVEFPSDHLVFNITRPNLTFFPADPSISNGTTLIICPGGSFCYLHIDTEGTEVAQWLNKKGVSAFVLKYRVVHSRTSYPMKEKNERMKDSANRVSLVIAWGDRRSFFFCQ
jgi:hypothetical protein